MLVFDTPGLIDETALTVNGINVKLGENPIGQFGTGLKIAAAVILRLGGRLYVLRGNRLLEFGVKSKVVRGESFDIVTLNGRMLGFTTKMGAHWEPWMAYRELASNTRDESGEIYQTTTSPQGKVRRTRIVIECPAVEQAHTLRHTVMQEGTPLSSAPGLDIRSGPSRHLFYRDLRVMDWDKDQTSMYSYSLKEHQYLTEDRTLRYQWGVKTTLTRCLVQCTEESILHSILSTDNKSCIEYNLPWSEVKEQKPSPQFMSVAAQLHAENSLHGSARSLFDTYKDTMPGYVSPYDVTPTAIMNYMMETAAKALSTTGMNIDLSFYRVRSHMPRGPVEVRDGLIHISANLFDQGQMPLSQAMMIGNIQHNKMGAQVFVLTHRILTGEWPSEDDSKARRALEFSGSEALF